MKTAVPFFTAAIFIFFLFLLPGCYKNAIDDYINAQLYAPKKILCRSWVKTEELHSPGNVIPNLFNLAMPCAKDNQYKFDKDGYYEINQGNSSCYSTQPFLIDQGNWEFVDGSSKLKVTYSNGSKTRLYNILALDSNYNFVTTYIDSSTGTKVMVKESFDPK